MGLFSIGARSAQRTTLRRRRFANWERSNNRNNASLSCISGRKRCGLIPPRQHVSTCRRRRSASNNPCLRNQTQKRIEPVEMIDRTTFHLRRIFALAQRGRDAWHHDCRDASDVTLGSTMNMAAENSNDPPGVLQSSAQPRYYLRCLEVDPVRPHHHLKWRMVRENRNRFAGLSVYQVDQTLQAFSTKVAFVTARTQSIQRDQSYRVVFDRVFDKVGTRREISVRRKCFTQIRPVILVAGEDIDRRPRLRENGHGLSVFVSSSVMNDVPGVHDHIWRRIERVYVRNRAREIPYSLVGIGSIRCDVGIGDLRDDHDARPKPVDCWLA